MSSRNTPTHQSAVEAAVVYCKPSSNGARVDGTSMNVGNKLGMKPSIRLLNRDNGENVKSLLCDFPEPTDFVPSTSRRSQNPNFSGKNIKAVLSDEWLPGPAHRFGDLEPRGEYHLLPRPSKRLVTPPQNHQTSLRKSAPLPADSSDSQPPSLSRNSTFARSAEQSLRQTPFPSVPAPSVPVGPLSIRHILNHVHDPTPHPLSSSRGTAHHPEDTRDFRSVASALQLSRQLPPQPYIRDLTHRAHDVNMRSPRSLQHAMQLANDSIPQLSARVSELIDQAEARGMGPDIGDLGKQTYRERQRRKQEQRASSKASLTVAPSPDESGMSSPAASPHYSAVGKNYRDFPNMQEVYQGNGAQTARRSVNESRLSAGLSNNGSMSARGHLQQPQGFIKNGNGVGRLQMYDSSFNSSYHSQYGGNFTLRNFEFLDRDSSSSMPTQFQSPSTGQHSVNNNGENQQHFSSNQLGSKMSLASSEDILKQHRLKRMIAQEMRRASDRGLAFAESLAQVADYDAQLDAIKSARGPNGNVNIPILSSSAQRSI